MLRTTACLLLLAISPLAWAQGDFDLTYCECEGAAEKPFGYASKWLTPDADLPARMPPGLGKGNRLAFTAHVAGRDLLIVTTDAEDEKAKLYMDLDGDGEVADEKPAPRHRGDRYRWYGPIELPVQASGGKLAAHFNITTRIAIQRNEFHVVLSPAGYRTGTVRLGDRAYRVAIADTNFNGRYNDVCDEFNGAYEDVDADCFGIDLTGNKRFGAPTEFFPLTKMIRVRGVTYSLRVLPDGSKVRLERVEPNYELGELDTASTDLELDLFSPELGAIPLHNRKGKWLLPSGTYTIMSSRLVRRDVQGTTWKLKPPYENRHGLRWGERPSFTIAAGETTLMKTGAPLVIEPLVSIGRRDRKKNITSVYVGFKLLGQGGEEYHWRASLDPAPKLSRTRRRKQIKERTDRPLIEIFDGRSDLLDSGRCHYNEPLEHVWQIKGGYDGKFRVKITFPTGHFPLAAQEPQWYELVMS